MEDNLTLKDRIFNYFQNDPYISTGKLYTELPDAETIKVDQFWHTACALHFANDWKRFDDGFISDKSLPYPDRKERELLEGLTWEYETRAFDRYPDLMDDADTDEAALADHVAKKPLRDIAKDLSDIILEWAGEIRENGIFPKTPLI